MSNAVGQSSREKIIVKTSIIGIVVNVFLAAFKAAIGLMSNSIAITLDAVNNISDAASSLITIVGAKLAAKAPDKEHPFGYGRIEYMSAIIISVLVFYAGVTSLIESAKQILQPETPDYNMVSLIIVAVAVVVKILLGRYVKNVGEQVNSDALINSGEDARLDSVISASTLVAAGIFLTCQISLEAWLGAIIAVVIIKAGIDMLREIAFSHKHVRQIYGFYLTKETKNIRFDLVISLAAENRQLVFAETLAHIQREFPDYELQAVMDTDFSEE